LAGALQSYKKALAIREALAAANPNDASIQSELLNSYFHLSFVLMDAGTIRGFECPAQRAPMAQKLAVIRADPKYKDYLAGSIGRPAAS